MTLHPLPVLPSLTDLPGTPEGLGGLLAGAARAPTVFPLRDVRVRAVLTGSVCRTTVEQRYANPLPHAMEAVHIFPVPPGAALTEVELRCGEISVRADLRERAQADAAFAAARDAGHRAALVTRERDDVHTLRVTNLPPGEEVTVRLVLVEQLDAVDGLVRWRFPTTIAPRFMPGEAVGHAGPGVHPDTDLVPDASRIQAPVRLQGGTRLDLEVQVEGRPTKLVSSLHAVQLSLEDGVRVALSSAATCDRDFVLGVSYAASAAVGAHAWSDGAYTLVTVEPPAVPPPAGLPRDAVFVLDISGSMGGSKIEAARRALKASLRGLVPGDRFLVLAFDDRVERHSAGFVAYDDRSMAGAEQWIDRLHARGGTVMLPPLQEALAGETPAGRLRTVLFITDGQAGDEDRLVAAVAGRRGVARVFTLGIDTAVNESLLVRLARVGGGTCELCTPRDDIEGVVAALEARVGTPLADDVRVEGGVAARPEPASLFSGRPVSVLLEGAPATVRITGRTAAGPLALEVPVARSAGSLQALYARERVAFLEDRLTLRPFEEEAIVPEIRRVALAGGIVSRCTAFVAVESSRVVGGPRQEVVQPLELPADWEGGTFADAAAPGIDYVMASAPASAPYGGGRPSGPSAPARPAPKAAGRMRSVLNRLAGGPPADEEADDAADMSLFALAESARAYSPAAPPPPPSVAAPSGPDPAASLVGSQRADGSFDGDVGRTAAALAALVVLGHTRSSGRAQRTVLKAAAWLAAHAGDPRAALALASLARAEAGEALTLDLSPLYGEGAPGALLRRLQER